MVNSLSQGLWVQVSRISFCSDWNSGLPLWILLTSKLLSKSIHFSEDRISLSSQVGSWFLESKISIGTQILRDLSNMFIHSFLDQNSPIFLDLLPSLIKILILEKFDQWRKEIGEWAQGASLFTRTCHFPIPVISSWRCAQYWHDGSYPKSLTL